MFKEFPKCLYQGGTVDGEAKIVLDEQAQADAANDGFLPLGEAPKDEAPKRRGRPPKAE